MSLLCKSLENVNFKSLENVIFMDSRIDVASVFGSNMGGLKHNLQREKNEYHEMLRANS